MRIKGKLCIKELKIFMIAAGLALAIGLVVYGFFAVLSLMSWVLGWMLLSLVITPIVFWVLQFLRNDIDIEDTHETEDSSIELHDSYW